MFIFYLKGKPKGTIYILYQFKTLPSSLRFLCDVSQLIWCMINTPERMIREYRRILLRMLHKSFATF